MPWLRLQTALVGCALAGCMHSMEWTAFSRQSGYLVAGNVPLVLVTSSAESASGYDGFLERTLVAARGDLHMRGIETLPFDPPDPATVLPRVELSLLDWVPARSYSVLVAGAFGHPCWSRRMSEPASAVVEVKAFSPTGKVTLQGQFQSRYYERYLSDAADAAGHSVAEELAEPNSAPDSLQLQSSDNFTPPRGSH
jgi:hypothetical protein